MGLGVGDVGVGDVCLGVGVGDVDLGLDVGVNDGEIYAYQAEIFF